MAQDLAPSERIPESFLFYEIHIAAKYLPKFLNHLNEFEQPPRSAVLKRHQNIYIAFGPEIIS